MLPLLFADSMARIVRKQSQRVTVLTDIRFGDHSDLDRYFQVIYSPDTSLSAWKRMVKEDTITIKCNIVAILVGNSQVPFPPDVSVASQLKKLILAIWESHDKIRKVVVLTLLPRPDKECELEDPIKQANNSLYKAVREVRRFHVIARNTGVMPVHRLFLERYEYFDMAMGRTAYLLRIIKPVTRNFVAGSADLNVLGLYHIRSYVLQELGILSNVNTWDGIPNRWEPTHIQAAKRHAWLLAKQHMDQEDWTVEDQDTDVEDERPEILVVPDSQPGSEGGSSHSENRIVL